MDALPRHTGPGASLRQDSALKHATGEARFADDLPMPPSLLHAALVLSPVAHGRLAPIDLSPAFATPGVVAAIGPGDIPGRNDIAQPRRAQEHMLAEGLVEYWGQPLAIVVAETRDAALAAAAAVRPRIEPLRPVLSVEEALDAGSFLFPPMVMARGDAAAALAAAPRRLSGTFQANGQEHFYLEGQIALVVPGEDGELTVHSSTQNPTEVQVMVARVLGCDHNRISVQVRRMGGAFGGKESNASWVAACAAVAARRTGRPVKLRLGRKQDMAATGKRHPFLYRWQAGFDDTGRILALDATMAADGGHSVDLSGGVVFRSVTHGLNVIDVPDVTITGVACKTNTVSNTAFRGFGGPQGVLLMEDVTHGIARALGTTQEAVRERNLAGGENNAITPYGQALEGDLLRQVWAECRDGAEWDRRRAQVDAFNAGHEVVRRGLGSFLLAFGISFGIMSMNQAGALVHVYEDGSIRLNHGGTEMGQGLFIKIAQIVAGVFGVPVERVRITATSTAEVPNTAPTAASTGTDLNGWAAQIAASTIRTRMAEQAAADWGVTPDEVRFEEDEVFAGNHRTGFGELAHRCVQNRVSLSSTGFYKTPGIHWDPAAMKGEPFFYFSYGAAVAEVELDLLTGEHRLLRADMVQDCGRSLNPSVDRGQIEGAFVQGLGWLTCEELWWDAEGRLRTLGPSTYKIPGSRDVPPVFNVRLLEGAPARADTVFRSKAVGEPPLMLATAVWNALRDAAGADRLDLPATPERLLMAARAGRR
ncbi:xanthine dehydrogenase molybdopterin binding subunit [Pararoseomonas indoligenes]|uniref:Xanthine dehydrogenase molybdopterin binding subunit n=1 Tax=Roseomonas indoligenes TaxID=2820811 RepID=A0A940N041_9PROT|nr:xanthine dehydrogenase molybdopterin binding subunit [Pararoseomonas indoligenes]MBP0494828.1 xanthine dehydrogenase molybdopterin binding subunit [Pararoseomonas indoligenes]